MTREVPSQHQLQSTYALIRRILQLLKLLVAAYFLRSAPVWTMLYAEMGTDVSSLEFEQALEALHDRGLISAQDSTEGVNPTYDITEAGTSALRLVDAIEMLISQSTPRELH